MEKKKNYKKVILIILLVVFVLLLKFGFWFALIFIESNYKISYLESNNVVDVDKGKFTFVEESSIYNEENNCYVLNIKVERNEKINKSFISKIFNSDYELDITYNFYDKDGYLLGEGSTFLTEVNKNDKWKAKISYCDVDANQVAYSHIKSISLY